MLLNGGSVGHGLLRGGELGLELLLRIWTLVADLRRRGEGVADLGAQIRGLPCCSAKQHAKGKDPAMERHSCARGRGC